MGVVGKDLSKSINFSDLINIVSAGTVLRQRPIASAGSGYF